MSIMSQNLIPVHIAFIPIVIPPLLSLFNDYSLVIGFGLCWPYVLLPYGFGQIFTKLFKAVSKAHHPIEFNMIWKGMLIPSLGYIVGLILGMFYYRKPREYKTETYVEDENTINEIKPYVLVVTIVAILATFLVQTFTDSMIFGALAGVLVFFISGVYKWRELDSQFVEGIKIMSFIGVVILSANGFRCHECNRRYRKISIKFD